MCYAASPMPTPVAHALAGTAVYLAARQDPARKEDLVLLGGTVFAACAADLDFEISFLTSHNYHHYFTHSLGVRHSFLLGGVFSCEMGRTASSRAGCVDSRSRLSHAHRLGLVLQRHGGAFRGGASMAVLGRVHYLTRAALRRHLERDAQRALRAPQLARGGAGSRDRGTGRRVCVVAAP